AEPRYRTTGVASQNRGPTPGRGGLATPGERTARIARPLEARPGEHRAGTLRLAGAGAEQADTHYRSHRVATQNRRPTPGRGGLATPGERSARIARPLEASPRRDEAGSLGLEGAGAKLAEPRYRTTGVASQNRGPTPGRGGLATPGERTARIARPLEA